MLSRAKKWRKVEFGTDVSKVTSKWTANFQLKRSKVKVTGRKNHTKLVSCLLTGGSAGGSSATGAD